MKNVQLALEIPGAPAKDIELGLKAVEDFFLAVQVSPLEAATAWWKLEGEQEELSPRESLAADAWEKAQDVALEACNRPSERGLWPLTLEFDR